MAEEIKEILNDMKQIPIDKSWALNLEDYQCKLLLNYITNLQQEIKEANDSVTWWTNRFNALQKESCNFSKKDKYKQERDIYKQRNGKAIEYIENHFLYHYGSDKEPIVFEDNYIQEIVDILKGED